MSGDSRPRGRSWPARLAMAAVAVTAFAPQVANADMCEEHAPERVLVVEDGDGRVVHREPVRPGDRLLLSWVHSSENVPVRGSFTIEADGSLRVDETAYAGFGPGLPAPQPGDAWQYRDGMIVTAGGASLPELRLRVTPIARQRLTLPSGREVDLPGLFPGGAAVRIGVR